MARIDYPTSLPMDSVTNVIRIVRNGAITTEVKDFAADLWNITGYLLSIVPGSPLPVINGQPPSDEQRKVLLELAQVLADVELPEGVFASAGDPQPVGSDLSVFFREVSTLGFVKALSNFILRIFNLPVE